MSGNVTSARTPKLKKTSARSEVVPIAAMKQQSEMPVGGQSEEENRMEERER